MAKTKITALTTLADGSIANGDLIPIVDVDDFSQAASGTTKKVTITSLASAVATAFSGDSPTFVNLNTTGTTTLGDSGDATTINGTLGVTGVTTLTGNVGIGGTPTNALHIINATQPQLRISSNGTDNTRKNAIIGLTSYINTEEAFGVIYADTNGGANNELNIGGGTSQINSANQISFFTSASTNTPTGTERLKIDNNGAVTIAGTLGVTGLLTVAANIKFPATQVASADANTLDDYEESTWNPTLGGSWTTNPTSISGSYVKIGRCVNIFITFVGGAKSTATSGYFEGLPISITISGTGSVVDSSVIANGSALFANTDRVWVTGTSFSNTNYISGFYFSAS